jgi:hypothetical protein
MEAAGSSETLITIQAYKTIRYENPEYRNPHFHRHGNIKSHINELSGSMNDRGFLTA